jgi:tellurite resistance protein
MLLPVPPPDRALLALRAIKAIAMANGSFDAAERWVLAAAARVLELDSDIDALVPVSPEGLAREIGDDALRRQLVHLLIVTSMADGEASEEEAELVERFTEALGLPEASLRALRRLAVEQMQGLRFDLMRRIWAMDRFAESYYEEGLTALLRLVGTGASLPEDHDLAERFGALAHFPRDSFGAAYFRYARDNGFALPGERRGPPEPVLRHDLTHVIAGYGTDPAGELEVAAFTAGYRHTDPFAYLFFVRLELEVGVGTSPVAKGVFDGERAATAWERGAALRVDLSSPSWDYWALMSEPLGALRHSIGLFG